MHSKYIQQRKNVKKISLRPTSIFFFSLHFFFFNQLITNNFASPAPLPVSSQAIDANLKGIHTLGVAFTSCDIRCPCPLVI